jgi:hypothetical protein
MKGEHQMRAIPILILSIVLASWGGAFAAQPPGAIMAPVTTLFAATEGRGTANVDTLFTPDAIVIDESAPYRWSGPHAASAWLAHVRGLFAQMKMHDFKAAAGPPIEYSQAGNGAYLIVPLTLTGAGAPKAFRETGTMTFTFARTGGAWKISSAVWTTATASK